MLQTKSDKPNLAQQIDENRRMARPLRRKPPQFPIVSVPHCPDKTGAKCCSGFRA
jgi:hypothetical protein